MINIAPILIASFLGLGAGIFTALSLIEKPVWRLMWARRSPRVSDDEARTVHAMLKRIIHLFPPTMATSMAIVSVLMIVLIAQEGASAGSLMLAGVFFTQLVLIVARLRKDIRGVNEVNSQGDMTLVRNGLGALALLHHRGLLMTVSTLIAISVFVALQP